MYFGHGIDFEISRTPGTLNLERFTLFQFNDNIKRLQAQRKQFSKQDDAEMNETLILKEKMAKYKALKRSELIERLAVFKKLLEE